MSNDERIEDVEQNVLEFNIAPFENHEMSREDKERMQQKVTSNK